MKEISEKSKSVNNKKAITIILLIVTVLIVVITSTIVGVYFGLKKNVEKPLIPLENNYFTYALVEEQGSFGIPESIFGGNNINVFKVISENNASLVLDGYVITLKKDGVNANTEKPAVYHFFHGDVLSLTLEVYVVSNPVFIQSLEDLNMINAEPNDYVQANDIDLKNKSLCVELFEGRYFGNHFKITNLDISEHGTLFKKTQSASFLGVVLDHVSGNINENLSAVGSLIGRAYDTSVIACSVSGKIEYEGSSSENIINIGALIGKQEKSIFKKDEKNQCYLKACEANVILKINAPGTLYIGGLVGNLKNTLIENCQTNGSIEVATTKVGLNTAVIGSIVGFLAFDIDLSYVTGLDRDAPLAIGTDFMSTLNINLKYFLDSANLFVGGLFGYVENYQLAKLSYLGSVNVDIHNTASDICLGGAVGALVNSVHRMDNNFTVTVEEFILQNALFINSTGKKNQAGDTIWGKTYVGGAVGLVKIHKESVEIKAVIFENIFVSKINSNYGSNPNAKEGQIFGGKLLLG